jgi:hypothetical protein
MYLYNITQVNKWGIIRKFEKFNLMNSQTPKRKQRVQKAELFIENRPSHLLN